MLGGKIKECYNSMSSLGRALTLSCKKRKHALQDTLHILGISVLEKIIRETDSDLQIAQDNLKQREHELQEFLHSTSWRATAPLRRLKDRQK